MKTNNFFNKETFSSLVIKAKGANRTVQQFAADIGVPPSTLSRIINKKNSSASNERILVAIAENAEPESRVTLNDLKKANGLAVADNNVGIGFEAACERIIVDDLMKKGVIRSRRERYIERGDGRGDALMFSVASKYRIQFDMLVDSEKFGKWAFEFKGTHGMAAIESYKRWLLLTISILQNTELDKVSLVVPNKQIYEQIKRMLDEVMILGNISVIIVDVNKKEVIEEYCIGRRYGLWRGFEDKKIFLTDILKERFKRTYETNSDSGIDNFCKDRRKELVDLFRSLGIEHELEMFKGNEGKHKGYMFFISEVPFINGLLDERTKRLVPVRKGEYVKLTDEYAIILYENIFNMFLKRCDGSEEMAFKQSFGLYNVLDIPIHKQRALIRQMQKDVESITDKIFTERVKNITSRRDDLAWLKHVTSDLSELYSRNLKIYDLMYEIRQEEVNNKAFEEYNNMSAEELDLLEEEEFLTLRIHQEYIYKEKVRKLIRKKADITGETLPWEMGLHNQRAGKSTDELTLEEINKIRDIEKQLETIYQGIRERILKETIAESGKVPFEKDFLYSENEYMSSEDLVKNALTAYENRRRLR
ncbi:hypothetical protein [Butyrivibrio sp. INlla16]|uniref:hypothetical protein n=1 Tax=Butyrivibrio sp. INlla16 TaxID=1520807 RepID=UPI00088814AA|nr:hypothetical protein [Butyrivibrio sp. INlla16]SDB69724.1 hypothetical protein SAMN02910263_04506 [Butyrivibrio sp. INlla16]